MFSTFEAEVEKNVKKEKAFYPLEAFEVKQQ